MKVIFIFILISAIIGLIPSKTEKFLSKSKAKNPSIAPASFVQENDEKRKEQSNGINLENFLRNFGLVLPKTTMRKEDYLVKDQKDQKKVKFNFLKNTKYSPDATVVKIDGNQTIKLSGKKDYKNSYINTLDNYTGVIISFRQEGDQCNKNGKRHQTTFLVKCDYSNKNLWGDAKFTSDDDNCNHQIEMSFSFGCSLTSGVKLYIFLNEHKVISGFIMICIGIAICILGARYFTYNIFLISGSFLSLAIVSLILKFYPELLSSELKIMICLGVSFILGCILGIWLKNKIIIPLGILGGFLGYKFFSFIASIFGAVLKGGNEFELLDLIYYYIFMILFICLGVSISFDSAKEVAIVGTAVYGGYIAASHGFQIAFPDYSEYSTMYWITISGPALIYQCMTMDKIGPLFDCL